MSSDPRERRAKHRVLKSASRIPDPGPAKVCDRCGCAGPAHLKIFRQNIGLLVVRQWRAYDGYFCNACARSLFWQTTLITLFVGWWSPSSLFITPVYLVLNVINFL